MLVGNSVIIINFVFVEFEDIHTSEFDPAICYAELKDVLFPKSGSPASRKPAVPGPTDSLKLFERAMSLIVTLKV